MHIMSTFLCGLDKFSSEPFGGHCYTLYPQLLMSLDISLYKNIDSLKSYTNDSNCNIANIHLRKSVGKYQLRTLGRVQ